MYVAGTSGNGSYWSGPERVQDVMRRLDAACNRTVERRAFVGRIVMYAVACEAKME